MKEKRVIGFALILGITLLAEVFILLFAYASSEWGTMSKDVIDPLHTIIATGVMILVGIVVYIKRNRMK